MFAKNAKRKTTSILDGHGMNLLFSQMTMPCFVLNAEGQVILWNNACATLTGMAADKLIGTSNHWQALYREKRLCLADIVLNAAKSGQTTQAAYANITLGPDTGRAENWCDLPFTKRRYLAFDVGVIRDIAGEVIGVVEFLHDQTESEEARIAARTRQATAIETQARVVTSVGAGLQQLSEGNLTAGIDEAFTTEYEKLRIDFNSAMTQLEQSLQTITARGEALHIGTSEITRAADDLSARTEQQAASLKQTASALDEITATVRNTAGGADEAHKLVSTAQAQAEASGRVVEQAVQAMSQIDQSSRQISHIIGVIDEIAFQTNLLALNAGVEAARAGDAGRGFAVVASEVRALAQRSADAAKEIKTLISASTSQVADGVKLVAEAGRALTQIAGYVAQINGVVREIAASAREQSTGLVEVNAAINQMDRVTQQNAAMVEQTTAASHSLREEILALTKLIGKYRIGNLATPQLAKPPFIALRPAALQTV